MTTKKEINQSIVRIPKHQLLLNLGEKLYEKIVSEIKLDKKIEINDIATSLIREYKHLFLENPKICSPRYLNIPMIYHPQNETSQEELETSKIEKIIHGADVLLKIKNNELEELEEYGISIHVRNHNCTHNSGKFNTSTLIEQTKSLDKINHCYQENREFGQCEAFGRTGYLVKLVQ